jgi:signal transduction histidine kinase/CHASE3 domain sensor protein
MIEIGRWWDRVRVQQKDWILVAILVTPLIVTLAVHVTLIHKLRDVQKRQQQAILARDQIHHLNRLTVDIEDAFRGYLLTEQDAFLAPMQEAEAKLVATIAEALALVEGLPGYQTDVRAASDQLYGLLESKHALINKVKAGHIAEVVQYVRSGKGVALSNALRGDFRAIEDRLTPQIHSLDVEEASLAGQAFWGLLVAVILGFALGLLGVKLVRRSLSHPLTVLQASVAQLIKGTESDGTSVAIPIRSSDEIGQLARSCEKMILAIRRHIHELETINAIGNEINTIGPDGLYGVLRRITDRAAEMLQVDICLVMVRDERMGCWIVESASGEWFDSLHKTVMLWEEFPVAVQSFETGQPAIGEEMESDPRLQVVRPNLMGKSSLSIPLLSGERPFGVLVLLLDRTVPRDAWNVRLAKGFAEAAAIAIANARLYEAASQKGKGLASRLRQLEHLAETLAHDLKAPGERMEGLASLLLEEYGGRLDERATRLLTLIQENGKDLIEQVENILNVARLGAPHEAIEAVDPALVIGDVLKAKAGDLESRRVRVHVEKEIPLVACHRAYLRQVFDNLISNAIKFSGHRADPEIRIEARRCGERVQFSVSDNGSGIPPEHRERVFEPFVRVSAPSVKGSGIGLTIVKRIVELYGGQVWVEPESRSGCTVTFTLPALGELSMGPPRDISPGPAAPTDPAARPEKMG